MRNLAGIVFVLLLGFVLTSTSVMAKTSFDCYQDVCATITVPECVAPDSDFDVHVEGDIEGGDSFGVFSYGLHENADWSYSSDHIAVISSGTPVDGDGFNWGSTYSHTYILNRPAGTYSYTFVFGQRNGGGGWYDAAVDIDIDFAASSNVVALDIKPQSCPNPFNINKKGVLSAAIVGSADVDVTQIDPSTIKLAGVSPLRYSYEDVTTLYEPRTGKAMETDCTDAGPDGRLDLTMKFKARDIVQALDDAGYDLTDGNVIVIAVSGETADTGSCQSTISGEDVIRVINKE